MGLFKKNNVTAAKALKIASEKNSDENKLQKKINDLLMRKDIQQLENEKVDALRMLSFYLESPAKECGVKRIVDFLKS